MHDLKVVMLPKFYLLISGRLYMTLNLNMFIIFVPLLLLLTSCTIVQIHKETLLLASTIWLIFTIFSWTKANFPCLGTVYMFGL